MEKRGSGNPPPYPSPQGGRGTGDPQVRGSLPHRERRDALRLPALFLVNLLEVGIDHLVIGLALARLSASIAAAGLRTRSTLGLVHGLADLLRRLEQALGLRLDG